MITFFAVPQCDRGPIVSTANEGVRPTKTAVCCAFLQNLARTLPRHLRNRTSVLLYGRNKNPIAGPDIIDQEVAVTLESYLRVRPET